MEIILNLELIKILTKSIVERSNTYVKMMDRRKLLIKLKRISPKVNRKVIRNFINAKKARPLQDIVILVNPNPNKEGFLKNLFV